MFSKMLMVGVAAVCTCVGVASATTTKIAAFVPAGSGNTANAQVDGTGTVKFNSSTGDYTRLHLQISDLEPNQAYGVLVESDIAIGMLPYAFTTNGAGHGVLIYDGNPLFFGDLTGNPVATIFISDEQSPPVFLDGDRAEVDALGLTRAESVLR